MSNTVPTKNLKRTEWGAEVDISEVDELTRQIALTVGVGTGAPWWNHLSAARQIIHIIEEHGGTVVYPC